MESKLRPLAPIGIYRDFIVLYKVIWVHIGSIRIHMGPYGPKVGPKWAQSGPKWAQVGPSEPKWAQVGPKWALYIINIGSSGLSFDSIYGMYPILGFTISYFSYNIICKAPYSGIGVRGYRDI